MNGKKAKKLRKYILKNVPEVLIQLRNELGSKTEEMGERAIYQNAKRLFLKGKLNIN